MSESHTASRYVYPDPKNDRSWTKAEWKKWDRASRMMNRMIAPKVDALLIEEFSNLVKYGTTRPDIYMPGFAS